MKESLVTGDYQLVKNLNLAVVLNLIRTKAPISGAELAKITRMRPSTVMKILRRLEKDGVIEQTGVGESTDLGGRRPILWDLRPQYGYVIGLQIEVNEIQGLLLNLKSQIEARVHLPLFEPLPADELVQRIETVVNQLVESAAISPENVLGLGIGISGMVDYRLGTVVESSLFRPEDQPCDLKGKLEPRFPFPIFIENDANAAVLAEQWYGWAATERNVVLALCMLDTGVAGLGLGLILDGSLYRGTNMFAGEADLGYLDFHNILSQFSEVKQRNGVEAGNRRWELNQINTSLLLDLLQENHPVAMAFFQEVGRALAQILLPVVQLLDPGMVVVSGRIGEAGHYLLEPLRKNLLSNLSEKRFRQLSVVQSALPEKGVALGAATLALQTLFRSPVDVATKMQEPEQR